MYTSGNFYSYFLIVKHSWKIIKQMNNLHLFLSNCYEIVIKYSVSLYKNTFCSSVVKYVSDDISILR